jgi:hypothetical protein
MVMKASHPFSEGREAEGSVQEHDSYFLLWWHSCTHVLEKERVIFAPPISRDSGKDHIFTQFPGKGCLFSLLFFPSLTENTRTSSRPFLLHTIPIALGQPLMYLSSYTSTLRMEAACSFGIWMSVYKATQCHKPEDLILSYSCLKHFLHTKLMKSVDGYPFMWKHLITVRSVQEPSNMLSSSWSRPVTRTTFEVPYTLHNPSYQLAPLTTGKKNIGLGENII